MFRALFAFFALSAAAFVLAPTVASMHDAFATLDIHRELPWRIWKWTDEPSPPDILPPDCDPATYFFESEVTKFPTNIAKNESFSLGGMVIVKGEGRVLGDVTVDVFLNATKTLPGDLLGRTTTTGDGSFTLTARIPFALSASHYHIVAHALPKTLGCKQYTEHWSDPEVNVTSKTRVVFDLPEKVVIGREVAIGGWIRDEVGAPVRNANVSLVIDGVSKSVNTGANGSFAVPYTPTHEGFLKMSGAYAGNAYYAASEGADSVAIVPEDFVIDGYDGSNPVGFTRGSPITLTGRVTLPLGATPGPMTLTLQGVPLQTCETCTPTLATNFTPDKMSGKFAIWLLAPSTGPGGPVELNFSRGGLRESYSFPGIVRVPTTIALESRAENFFSKSFVANATVLDETGRALPLDVSLHGPGDAWFQAAPGANAFSGEASCGTHRIIAYYNGSATHMPTQTQQDVSVCGYLAFVPAWLLAVPWWSWALILASALALAVYARSRYERTATTITRGPALVLEITQPRDVVSEIVSPGETAHLTAALEAPLPEGARLRLGWHNKMIDVEIDSSLRAGLDLVPNKVGDLALRGEIVDQRGRVITRRTLELRVVRYAEEIEKRYKRLRRESVGEEAEVVSPREFEVWLRERAPTLDNDIARRLVDIFEESDYGPREAGRRELLAFVAAELGILEASPRVE